MQFREGDRVLHPVHGVGQIQRIERKTFIGDRSRLYYQIQTLKGTVWVPVDAQQAVGLRLLTQKTDLKRLGSILKSRPASLKGNHSQRHLEIASRLNDGSLEMICRTVRDLIGESRKKSLSVPDSTSLRKARVRLQDEWAAVEGISVAKATEVVEALLEEGHKAYK